MSDLDKNINDSGLAKLTDFTNELNRMYASVNGSEGDGYVIIKELIDYILGEVPGGGDMLKSVYDTDNSGVVDNAELVNGKEAEEKIYIPSTQPSISGGNLTFDMDNNRQAMFEGRLSVGTLSINTDFNWIISNDSNALLMSSVLSLTGTRIITFEADVDCTNPSSIGSWSGTALTLTAGTDDLIEFQLLRYSTNSRWILKVGEVKQ